MSWRLASLLAAHGLDVVHVNDIGLANAPDTTVMRAAIDQRRVLVTMDGDFATMLATTGNQRPSILLLRIQAHARPIEQIALLNTAIREHSAALRTGAIVVVTDTEARVRNLPLPRP